MRYLIWLFSLMAVIGPTTARAYDPYLMEYGGRHDWKRLAVRMDDLIEIGSITNRIEILVASAHMAYVRHDFKAVNRNLKALDDLLRHMAQERLESEESGDDDGRGESIVGW